MYRPLPNNSFATTRSQARAAAAARPDDEPLQGNELSSGVRQLSKYQAIVYGFGGGHVHHTLSTSSIPIQVIAAVDMDAIVCSHFQELMSVPRVFSTARQLMTWIISKDKQYVDIYISHAPLSVDLAFVQCWWDYQADIIMKSRRFQGLQVFLIVVPSQFKVNEVSTKFQSKLTNDRWILSVSSLEFPSFGDSIDDTTNVILGVHRSTEATATALTLLAPPKQCCKPISEFIHAKFNESN
jgi:hypothetical protein